MSEAPTNPHESRPRTNREYEDPHYHDEEPDVQSDDSPRLGKPRGHCLIAFEERNEIVD